MRASAAASSTSGASSDGAAQERSRRVARVRVRRPGSTARQAKRKTEPSGAAGRRTMRNVSEVASSQGGAE